MGWATFWGMNHELILSPWSDKSGLGNLKQCLVEESACMYVCVDSTNEHV
jgi:hypothetical protein